MKTKIRLALFAIIVTGASAFGQCKGWTWPEDPEQREIADEKYALYNDLQKQGYYRESVEPLQWLLENAPNLNTSNYINGANIYQKLADAEQDQERKNVLVDSILWMYDRRIELCGDEVNVLNRKIYQAYKYLVEDRSKWAELFDMYDDAFKKSGDKFIENNLIPYMTIIRLSKVGLKTLTDDQVYEMYVDIEENINVKLKKKREAGQDVSKLLVKLDKITEMFFSMVDMNCDNVKTMLGPRFEANPNDLQLANRIFRFMIAGKCTDDPLWFEAARLRQKEDPEYGLAKILGSKCFSAEDYICAEQYYDEAIGLTEDGNKQAEIYLLMGKMKAAQGLKSGARIEYRSALAADPSLKEAYVAIGDLYMNSSSDCDRNEIIVEDRAIFIAAYDMYSRGGDATKMAKAKAQFPSVVDVFNATKKKGGQITIGCWINETVIIDTRD